MSPCLGKLKSFLATSTPSRKRYSWIFLRSALGISLMQQLVIQISNFLPTFGLTLSRVPGALRGIAYNAGGDVNDELRGLASKACTAEESLGSCAVPRLRIFSTKFRLGSKSHTQEFGQRNFRSKVKTLSQDVERKTTSRKYPKSGSTEGLIDHQVSKTSDLELLLRSHLQLTNPSIQLFLHPKTHSS